MIRPDVSLDTWLMRFPGLQVKEKTCLGCGTRLKTTIPVISNDYAGLTAPKCGCTNGRGGFITLIPVSEKEKRAWQGVPV